MIFKNNKQVGFIYKSGNYDKEPKEGIDSVSIQGSGRKFKELKISGNTKQESTTGKNLLSLDVFTNRKSNCYSLNSDGSINQSFSDSNSWNETSMPNYLTLKKGTYTISVFNMNGSKLQVGDLSSGGTIFTTNENTYTFTLTKEEERKINVKLYNATSYPFTFKIQLEEGSSTTDFEPYTGGISSPNPEYPQEIESAGDLVNLFDVSKISERTYINGYGLSTPSTFAETTVSNASNLSDYIKITKGITYTLSFDFVNLGNTSVRTYVFYNNSKTPINEGKNYVYNPSLKKFTFTATEDGYIRFCYPLDSFNVQLKEGSTVTPYEPYGYKIPVNVRSKNLFNYTYMPTQSSYEVKKTTDIQNQTITLDGICTVNGQGFDLVPWTTNFPYPTITNKSTFSIHYVSGKLTVPEGKRCIIRFMNKNWGGSTEKSFKDILTTKKESVTWTSSAEIGSMAIIMDEGVVFDNFTFKVMYAQDTDTSYQPFFNNIYPIYLKQPLKKLGGLTDTLVCSQKQVERKFKNVVLNGTENWVRNALYSTTTMLVVHLNIPDMMSNTKNVNSNRFIYSDTLGINIIKTSTTNILIGLDITKFPDVESWKNWLAQNNTYINYELATKTNENVELDKFKLVEGTNIIETNTLIKPTKIYVENAKPDFAKVYKNGKLVFERGFTREALGTELNVNSLGVPLKNYEVFGNTEQETTTGKQLFNIKEVTSVTNGSIANDLITSNVATNQYYNVAPIFNSHTLLANHTYYIVAEIRLKSGTGSFVKINDYVADWTRVSAPTLSNTFQRYVYKKTFSTNTNYYRFLFQFTLNEASVEIRNIMLSETDTNYEPYTGAQPSPNPDYSQEIESVGDKTKNLLKLTIATQTQKGLTITNNGNSLTINGRATGDLKAVPFSLPIKYKKDKNYTLSMRLVSGSVSIDTSLGTFAVSAFFMSGLTSQYARWYNTTQDVASKTYTFTEDTEGTPYLYFHLANNVGFATFDNAVFEYQLEEGSTATEYEPYGYKIPVNVRSENLLTNAKLRNGNAGILLTKNEDGSIVLNGKTNISEYLEFDITKSTKGNYNASWLNGITLTSFGADLRYVVKNSSGTNLSDVSMVDKSNYTYNYNDIPTKLIYYIPAGNTFNNTKFYPMFNKGTQPKPYQPYFNNTYPVYLEQPLRKNGDYADYIDWKEGKVVRNIGEVILDGSENWILQSINSYNIANFRAIIDNLKKIEAHSSKGFCNRLSQQVDAIANTKNEGFLLNEYKNIYIRINKNRADTINSFKTWLSQNNVKVDYVLETPVEEAIELPQIPTTNGNNIITIDTKVKPSNVWIKYKSNK